MQPELYNHGAPIVELPLEFIDLTIGALPVLRGAEALDALHHHAAIPGAVEDRNVPILWQARPEPPQIMVGELRRGRACNRDDLVSAGVERGGHTADIAAFAGGVPALVADDDGHALPIDLVVQLAQFLLELFELLFIFFIGDGLVQGDVLQLRHGDKGKVAGKDNIGWGNGVFLAVLLERQCGFNPVNHRVVDFQLRVQAVRAGDDMPGGIGGVGVFQHLVKCAVVAVVLFVPLPILLGDAPLRIFGIRQVFQTLPLFLLADVQEKFDNQIPVVRELPLEGVDVVHAAQVGHIVHLVLQAEYGDFLVPAAVHHRDFPASGDDLPIAPEVRFALFQLRGGNVGVHFGAARVKVQDQVGDLAALSSRTPPFEHNDDGKLVLLHQLLQGRELFLERGSFFFIFLFCDGSL